MLQVILLIAMFIPVEYSHPMQPFGEQYEDKLTETRALQPTESPQETLHRVFFQDALVDINNLQVDRLEVR